MPAWERRHLTEGSLGMRASIVTDVAAALALMSLCACADRKSEETLPANAKPLSEIIRALEGQGYKDIDRVKLDENVWVIKAHQAGGKEVEVKVNPITGQIVKTE